jgi:hypothetical protein
MKNYSRVCSLSFLNSVSTRTRNLNPAHIYFQNIHLTIKFRHNIRLFRKASYIRTLVSNSRERTYNTCTKCLRQPIQQKQLRKPQ